MGFCDISPRELRGRFEFGVRFRDSGGMCLRLKFGSLTHATQTATRYAGAIKQTPCPTDSHSPLRLTIDETSALTAPAAVNLEISKFRDNIA